jgi:mycoredoxin
MTKKIVMYSTTWCPDCHRTERILNEQQISFEKIDIEKVDGAAEIVMNYANGKRSVPTLVLQKENGQTTVLVNPRPQQLLDELAIA